MTHRVHPKAFRIKGMEDFNVRGFYHGPKMSAYLQEDCAIKDFLRTKFAQAALANIAIDRSNNKINITIETARPGVVIGRGGQGAEELKKDIEKELQKIDKAIRRKSAPRAIKIDVKEVKNPWVSAALVGQFAAQQIEKRIPFRQVLKRSMERVMQNKEVKGIKMEVSGRLNGTEIARTEWLKQGQMPLQTLRADIDYALSQAYCSYGVIGIKVWIYKGEKFE